MEELSPKIMYMVSSKFWRSISISILIISGLTLSLSHQVLADVDLPEDKLNTEKSLRWGGAGLPSDDIVILRDALVNSIVGKVVIDKHGEDNRTEESTGFLGGLLNSLTVRDPFGEPQPGRMTIVTLWGSKEEGCFVKALVHNAPKGDAVNPKGFVPVKMEVGVGDRVIKLTPASKAIARAAGSNYTYVKEYTSNYTPVKAEGSLYFAENTFAVNAKVADLFRNAPKGDAKIRITFANGDTKIFPVGAKNRA